MLSKFFKFNENNTNLKIELIAGIVTFLSMSYILLVNPTILSATGMEYDAVFMATIISSVVSCLVMGLIANLPIAQAPGMGINAFFTYTVVLTIGYTWQEALFSVFVSGVLFLIISITPLRLMIISMIPSTLKSAVSVGIGFFIAFIGFQNAGIIVNHDSTLVSIGDFSNPVTLLAILGTFLTIIFMQRKNNLGIFYSMIIVIIIAIIAQFIFNINLNLISTSTIISTPPSIAPVFGKLFDVDIIGLITSLEFWLIVFSFLFVDFFDTTGMLLAVSKKANLIDNDGNIKNGEKAVLSDAIGTISGSILGTSSVTSYVESLSGITMGGRTGLVAVVTAICFFLASFLSPILTFISPIMPAVTAPALIIVGIMMASNLSDIDFTDFRNSASSFMTIIIMLSSYSISEGISAGFITYIACSIASKKANEIPILMYIITSLFLLHYIL